MRDENVPERGDVYECRWPESKDDLPAENDETYTLAVAFVTGVRYSYQVKLCGRGGLVTSVIKDLDLSGSSSDEADCCAFRLLLG